jgi:hypothetical protein
MTATVGVVAAMAITTGTGAPTGLPDIALGSVVLFHIERTIALLGGYLAILVVVARAWAGELPTEMSAQGLKYATADAKSTAETVEGLEEKINLPWARIEGMERTD